MNNIKVYSDSQVGNLGKNKIIVSYHNQGSTINNIILNNAETLNVSNKELRVKLLKNGIINIVCNSFVSANAMAIYLNNVLKFNSQGAHSSDSVGINGILKINKNDIVKISSPGVLNGDFCVSIFEI